MNRYCVNKDQVEILRNHIKEEFIKKGLVEDMGGNLLSIKDNLGDPYEESVINTNNIHDSDQIDQIHVLKYPGLEIHVYHVNYDMGPYDIIFKIILTGNNYSMKYGLRLGNKRNDIIMVFGKPNTENGKLEYFIEESVGWTSVSFEFDKVDSLEKVEWGFSID